MQVLHPKLCRVTQDLSVGGYDISPDCKTLDYNVILVFAPGPRAIFGSMKGASEKIECPSNLAFILVDAEKRIFMIAMDDTKDIPS